MRGEVHNRKRRALLEGPRVRQGERESGGHHHQLALTTEPGEPDAPRPPLQRGNALPHGIDDSSHLVPDDARRLGGAGVEALASEQIGEVHARRFHPNADRARNHSRIGRVAHGEHFRRAMTRNDELLHGSLRATVTPLRTRPVGSAPVKAAPVPAPPAGTSPPAGRTGTQRRPPGRRSARRAACRIRGPRWGWSRGGPATLSPRRPGAVPPSCASSPGPRARRALPCARTRPDTGCRPRRDDTGNTRRAPGTGPGP